MDRHGQHKQKMSVQHQPYSHAFKNASLDTIIYQGSFDNSEHSVHLGHSLIKKISIILTYKHYCARHIKIIHIAYLQDITIRTIEMNSINTTSPVSVLVGRSIKDNDTRNKSYKLFCYKQQIVNLLICNVNFYNLHIICVFIM